MQVVQVRPGQHGAWDAAAVTVGNFDGVHRGHQALVAAAREAAVGQALVLTFDPHPVRVLAPGRSVPPIMSDRQREEALAAVGVDLLAVLAFDREVAGLSAERFVQEVLVDGLHARCVVVGEGFRFGRGRQGDVELLRRLGSELGFRAVAVDPVLHEGLPVSSTRIREALGRGDVALAAALLGRPHVLAGEVARGDARGRTLGFPTANLSAVEGLTPANGVYACHATLASGAVVPAAVNVGVRPTFDGLQRRIEAHLIGFEGDLYGTRLIVGFVERLRGERPFPGRDALVAQLHDDVAAARLALEGPGSRAIVPGVR
jgi:riboflavin kinase/FMN adenylyltransferase